MIKNVCTSLRSFTEIDLVENKENSTHRLITETSTVMSGATDQQVLSMLAAGGSIMHPSPAGATATGMSVTNFCG